MAMDSMKGCLNSYDACSWVSVGLQSAWPEANVEIFPVSDGGEGMTEMMFLGQDNTYLYGCQTISPLGDEMEATWLMVDKGEKCAYIDFSAAGGLTLVAEEIRNPLNTTSYGVGLMINDAIEKGIHDIRLGLGGSATVDAGFGALQALGLRLLATDGVALPSPFTGSMLADVADIEFTEHFKSKVENIRLTLLCDVESPFTGETGAAHVFGPQKGASEDDVDILENGMERVRKLIRDKIGIDLNTQPGSGAAGGAAGGLMALARGMVKKGASTLLDLTGFDGTIDGADLIVTGEGSSDRQTLMGKIPFEILKRGKRNNIPVWLVAGRVKDREALLEAGFEKIICINSPDIVNRSGTLGQNPMDPEVASMRLSAILN